MPDAIDDYVTVNITCEEAHALAVILTIAERLGVFEELPKELVRAVETFSTSMMREISNQKGV